MKCNLLKCLLWFCASVIPLGMLAQEKEVAKEEEPILRHSVAIVLGHATVFKARDENGKKKTLVLPHWGLDYNYHFNRRWALGLRTYFITENFVAEKEHGEEI